MTQTVHILGLGPTPREHATIETIQALADCREVHAQGFAAADLAFLRRVCRAGKVSPVPLDADPAALARRVVASAKAGRRAAFVTPLHPFHFGAAGPALAAACRAAKVPVRVLASVSAMGAAIARAGVTLGNNCFGLQSFEAGALSREKVVLNPIWPAALYFVARPSKDSLDALAAALAPVYPRAHPVTWCSGARAGRTEPLSAALAAAARAAAGDSLYLPPPKATRSRLGRTESRRLVVKGAFAPETVDS